MGGVTMKDIDDTEIRQLEFKSDNEADIKMLLAGMAAEDREYGEHTQGCSSDLDNATKIIYSMLTQDGQGDSYLNENTLMNNGISHLLTEKTVAECKERLKEYKKITDEILETNWDLLLRLANKLLEEKTIVQPTLEKIKEYPEAVVEPIK